MEDETPRSIEAKIPSPVLFCNNTGRKINLKWLNYNGEEICYGVLHNQRQQFPMNTFVTHPWIAVADDSQQKMWLNSKEFFQPPIPRYVRVRQNDVMRIRIIPTKVVITAPVYNAEPLQDYCCQVLAKLMSAEDIDELQIPKFLKKDIKKYQVSED